MALAVAVAVAWPKDAEEMPVNAKIDTNKRVFILWVLRVEKLKNPI